MKFFVIRKKTILQISFFILLFSFALFFIYFSYSFEITNYDTSLLSNDEDDFTSKIQNLTKQKEKYAYLTFDDGPTTKATPKILDILKEENVKASFFVVGKHVKENPDIVKREYEEGHFIANHGYSHNNKKLYSSKENFISEIKNTDLAIAEALEIPNYSSHIFRFPNGYMSSNNKSQKQKAAIYLNEINYTYIDWNCLNKDSEKKYSNYELLNNLKKTSKNKGTLVILMHDTNDVNKTTDILKESIDYLKSNGYEFKNFYDI